MRNLETLAEKRDTYLQKLHILSSILTTLVWLNHPPSYTNLAKMTATQKSAINIIFGCMTFSRQGTKPARHLPIPQPQPNRHSPALQRKHIRRIHLEWGFRMHTRFYPTAGRSGKPELDGGWILTTEHLRMSLKLSLEALKMICGICMDRIGGQTLRIWWGWWISCIRRGWLRGGGLGIRVCRKMLNVTEICLLLAYQFPVVTPRSWRVTLWRDSYIVC